MTNYAILIDAGFLKRKLGSRDNPVDTARIATFIERLCAHERLFSLHLHRIYRGFNFEVQQMDLY